MLFSLYFDSLMFLRNRFKYGLKHTKGRMYPLLLKMFIARTLMNKSWRYQVSRYQIIHHFKFLKSDNPYYFANISAFLYGTQMFLYSRRSYKSHLPNEICLNHLACLYPDMLFKQSWVHFFWDTLYMIEDDLEKLKLILFSLA